MRILFIATEYCGGMRPYALARIKSSWNTNSYAIIVLRDEKLISDFESFDGYKERIVFITYPTKKWSKPLFRFYPKRLRSAILDIVINNKIDLIHTLTGEFILSRFIYNLNKTVPVLHTVHDAIPHSSKFKNLFELIKERVYITYPNQNIIKNLPNLITNSKGQFNYLKKLFPKKNIYFQPFPSLVTENIASGNNLVPELENVNNYILFFGNLDLYKGIHLLYNLYQNNKDLHTYPLVIAGNGNIYFQRYYNETNTYFINRFVLDEEVSNLFKNAALVVYPYINGTQSGVLSLASYFDKKMVVSNIPFFKEECDNVRGIEIINPNNEIEFHDAIIKNIKIDAHTRSWYMDHYNNHTDSPLGSIMHDIKHK